MTTATLSPGFNLRSESISETIRVCFNSSRKVQLCQTWFAFQRTNSRFGHFAAASTNNVRMVGMLTVSSVIKKQMRISRASKFQPAFFILSYSVRKSKPSFARLIPRFLGARHRRTWAVAYPVAQSRSSAPPVAVRTALPCCAVPARSHCAVSWCGPVAVGRDVPIAPPRRGAVRGLASCAQLGRWGDRTPRPARAGSPGRR